MMIARAIIDGAVAASWLLPSRRPWASPSGARRHCQSFRAHRPPPPQPGFAEYVERRHFANDGVAVDAEPAFESEQHHAQRKIRREEDIWVARQWRKLRRHAVAVLLMAGRALIGEH